MASSDYSDLTDLDELDEEYSVAPARKGRGKGKGKGKAGADGYRIRHALKPPRATTYSTEALYKQIHSSDINLEPDYQREVVWPEAKQIGIIDSIFRNFYIPPVIFAVNAYDDGTETRTCIDGKQRLTSIHRPVRHPRGGLHPAHVSPPSLTGDKLWYRDNPANKTRQHKKILPEKYRRMFDNKAVVCVEYQDLADADEREIFQRVQLGVALTPAEKLKVLTTPRARFMRTLQETFLNKEEDGLGGDSLDWNRSRGSDFRCLAQTVQCIAQGTPKTTSMQATERWLADPAPVPPALSQRITSTYRVFEALVRDVKHTRVFQRPAKIAPIEFIAVGILIARHKDSTTLAGLASAIAAMRADVRTVHDDIRNNQKVYKTLVAFIEAHHAPAPTRGELAASAAVPAVTLSSGTKRKAAPASASDEEDELDGDADAAGDSDEDYAPARKAVAPTPRKRKTAAAAPPRPQCRRWRAGRGPRRPG
ncbi:hypothetical protein B0H10DRAFT_1804999 [Mycena sp. CBHHK59/15]|nr:hypothetical protein B0H10DRAFT_1804999 [Mycena sp. CBHHK59/15]